ENAATGRLTDGNLKYADGWVIHQNPPDPWILTFDLAKPCRLDSMLIYIDNNPAVHNYKNMAVELADKTEEGPWEKVYEADLSDILAVPLTHDTAIKVSLGARQARYMRLTIGTCGEPSRLGEVRIIGWPVLDGNRDQAGKRALRQPASTAKTASP
ncbi:MAG: hypothetical protein U9N87_04815, partial [Planctomycetota bacterium]|nr:hypothetical protein [Planctomycetota bacterium]